MIQIPYNCKKYKPNKNLNKTCDNKARCKIYYDEVCEEFKENVLPKIDEKRKGSY